MSERACAYCGAALARRADEYPSRFSRRKYCNRSCFAAAERAKGIAKRSPDSVRYNSRLSCTTPPGPCARCGSPNASDVHPRDGDHRNEAPENLARICRRCHIQIHHPRASCAICGRPQKAHSLCAHHLYRLRRYGDPKAGAPIRKRSRKDRT